ncbi:hypothetical protein STAFG_2894 [Streptomyces afghaniensis 772]|uniref:Uncharacterized protein n=1 Tax=Streptomyces afghaniensis 772 TaxID=1283301 RepID=S4N0P4_9ACTN|nr:hypothetical protein STAFG_2894 [Streptomyces afghaniensis 772]
MEGSGEALRARDPGGQAAAGLRIQLSEPFAQVSTRISPN